MKGRTRKAEEPKKRNSVSHNTTIPLKTKNRYSDSDSDETWTPDLERRKRAKGIFCQSKRLQINDLFFLFIFVCSQEHQ